MTRPVEIVCRALELARYEAKYGEYTDAERRRAWIDRHWREQEHAAKALLRSLKGQPPRITDAGVTVDFSEGGGAVLDAMLEAMARS